MAAMTEAVFAVVIGLAFYLWWVVSKKLGKGGRLSGRGIFLAGTLFVFLVFLFLMMGFKDRVVEFTKMIPFLSRSEERLVISENTIELVGDFPFTGGGLGAFPGLYSKYILVIPFFFIPNSYNMFLEIALEQGVIGCLAYVSILLGGAFVLIRHLRREEVDRDLLPLTLSLLACYWAIVVVGMVDAILYTGVGAFFLFVVPGFSVFTLNALERIEDKIQNTLPTIIMAIGLVAFLLSLGRYPIARYYSNLGAIEMARLDLADWPWEEGQVPAPASEYSPAVHFFELASSIDQGNRTANHRLGLIAVSRLDFQEGCRFLQHAYEVDPMNRGILKNLGYCYVWLGNLDSATAYLRSVPEASYELEVYSWWWGTKNRNDLSDYANQMVLRLISK